MFIRQFNSNYVGGNWDSVAGVIDYQFVEYVKNNDYDLYNYFETHSKYLADTSGKNGDLYHLAATMTLADYMTKSFNKNQKVSRTSDGLIAHHKAEDKMIMLSTKAIAEMCPYEWQFKENIVYCDYLEHLLLHVLICMYPSPEKFPMADVGIGGVVNFIVPELNDEYSGWKSKQDWRANCHNLIEEDKAVYLEILKMFIAYLIVDRDFNDKSILHTSFNEQFGGWSRKQNEALYEEIDKFWDNLEEE